ncbi:MAG: DUF2167 domain-containing protein [Verrucomicrobiota bacterium]
MKKILSILFVILLVSLPLSAQESEGRKIPRIEGPTNAVLAGVAEIAVPAGYLFIDGKTTRAMMESAGEPVSGNEAGFLAPTNRGWAVYFQYDNSGYVKDDDKDKLDADKLLQAIKKGNDAGNEYRKERGNPTLDIVGWEQEPKYDDVTHNLTWAIRATSQGEQIVNYNTRLLGRKGVMEVVLVCDPAELKQYLPTFHEVLAGYKYSTGESYAEYKPGDKLAKYGLGALVLGGAGVGAAKLGLFAWLAVAFKKFGKFVIILVVAVAAVFRKFFAKIFNRNRDQ